MDLNPEIRQGGGLTFLGPPTRKKHFANLVMMVAIKGRTNAGEDGVNLGIPRRALQPP